MTFGLKIEHFLGIFFSSLNKVKFFQDSREYRAYYYTSDSHRFLLLLFFSVSPWKKNKASKKFFFLSLDELVYRNVVMQKWEC